ncbi:glycoside hydrolase family 18 protein [Collybiopsis luxurians FD-317 M1]|uniref:Glycoside hydrolase family 18 protein n=1 Tax=Collybiopsis luxurians FD-317 M1 TaxID=944289 RepID=A0A0D0BHB1_9AGAR|nr:glycoside hydrolase family 18 protein [Collybiopsis luxurians FD-317 M1]
MFGRTILATTIFAALACMHSVIGAPLPDAPPPAAPPATSGAGGVPQPPHFVVYNDRGPDPAPDPSAVAGFNVVAMSFMLSTGPADMALTWQQLPAAQRQTIKASYEKAGIKLVVSAFGSTELPTTSGKDPKALASTMAQWVKDNDVDGIDVDYEDLQAMSANDGKAEQWLVDFTTALRAELPQGQYILTHAPLAPWFSKTTYKSGAYLTVDKQVGSMIDWYNVQFYNQGATEYTDCNGLLNQSKAFPGTSVFEIGAAGIPLNKIVIGKPGATSDASNGYIDPLHLRNAWQRLRASNGVNAGVMSWQYPNANAQWISTVKGSAFK